MRPEHRRVFRGWQAYVAIGALIAAVAVFGPRAYLAIESDLSTAAVAGRISVSELAAATLTLEFERIIDIGRSLASRVRFNELVAEGRWDEAIKIMESVPRDFAGIAQVMILDSAGAARAQSPVMDEPSRSFANTGWFATIRATGKPVVTSLQNSQSGQTPVVFFVAAPIGKHARSLNGVVVLRVTSKRIDGIFDALKLQTDGALRVSDQAGQCVYDSSGSMPISANLREIPALRSMLDGPPGVVEYDDKGVPTLAAFTPASAGWAVVAQWPTDSVFAARDAAMRRLTVALALIVAMTIVALATTLWMVSQRKQVALERQMKEQLERQVRERTDQLEAKNRELESFSYSISHDLRAPLRAIDGFSQLLMQKVNAAPGSEAHTFAGNVQRNVTHMSRLIDELLELSRIARVTMDPRPVDMTALALEAIKGLTPEQRIVQTRVDPLPMARGDVALLRQVWINLIDNAIKYSARQTAPCVSVTCATATHETVYCVADNGAGFDMKYYEHLFKPFSRLHNASEFAGTGIGLALVKRIIERHGGRMWADSAVGQGTKVFFALPS